MVKQTELMVWLCVHVLLQSWQVVHEIASQVGRACHGPNFAENPTSNGCTDLCRSCRAGTFMHSHCFAQYTRFNYSCPVCSKSMGDMSIYFGMLDSIVARDLADLPPAYQMRQQVRRTPGQPGSSFN